tara:strand:+ start:4966 stop:5358 length:393 start_codon:yes stop_codon:yes gene_type:complete
MRNILVAVMVTGLMACTGPDFELNNKINKVFSDIDTIHEGVVHFNTLNKGMDCPSISRLFDDGFINSNTNEYGSLKNSRDIYELKKDEAGGCRLIARDLGEKVCEQIKGNIPSDYLSECKGNGTLQLWVH